VPPLRERAGDIPALLSHYLALYERQYQRPARVIDEHALGQLCRFDWPGNVRALRHACERAVILGGSDQYRYADFGLGVAATPAPVAAPAALRLGAVERDTIAAALAQAQGNISHAAKMLGVSRAALYRKLGKHGI
jgi:DNA-binding NtrC family response regulator